MYPVEDHSNWMEFYPDAGEEILKNLPPKSSFFFNLQRVKFEVGGLSLGSFSFSTLISSMLRMYPDFTPGINLNLEQSLWSKGN
jgi:hypothetical protein